MRIEDQVVPLQISNKLQELGINVESVFYHVYPYVGSGWKVIAKGYFDENNDEIEAIPAYTVSELGLMLPISLQHGSWEESLLNCVKDIANQWHTSYPLYFEEEKDVDVNGNWQALCGNWIKVFSDTEAKSRAMMLIKLLEDGHISAHDVNINFTTKSL